MRFYVIVIDVAAPGRSVHHLGITPGGVICGHRDNSAIGRSLRARALACTHVDPHRGRARPGIIAPGVIAWPPGFASTTGRPAMEPGSFSRTQGSANAGQRRLCTPVPAAATPLPSSVPRHDRAVRREVGRDQNCARLAAGPIATQPGNLRACHRGPLPGQAGRDEAGGSHHRQHQRLASQSSLRAGQRAEPRARWPGAQRPAGAGTDMPSWVPSRSGRAAGRPGCRAPPRAGAARFTLPRVTGG